MARSTRGRRARGGPRRIERVGRLGRRWRADGGGVSTIAAMAALTIGVLAAAGIVVGVMMDHARAVPGPGGPGAGSGAVVGP